MKTKFTALQEDWLRSLESGEYKQGVGVLKRALENNKYEYCCLGVACEVYNLRQKRHKKKQLKIGHIEYNKAKERYITYNGCESQLPPIMIEKLKLLTDEGMFYKPGAYVSLAHMNDVGVTHKEIAQYIRKNPENVFTNFSKE